MKKKDERECAANPVRLKNIFFEIVHQEVRSKLDDAVAHETVGELEMLKLAPTDRRSESKNVREKLVLLSRKKSTK